MILKILFEPIAKKNNNCLNIPWHHTTENIETQVPLNIILRTFSFALQTKIN